MSYPGFDESFTEGYLKLSPGSNYRLPFAPHSSKKIASCPELNYSEPVACYGNCKNKKS